MYVVLDRTIALFEQNASRVWELLELSSRFRTSIGEETVTDLLALEFARAKLPTVRIRKFTKKQESQSGADIEVCFRSGNSWAIQAKRLIAVDSPVGSDYYRLQHNSQNGRQIDSLLAYSRSIPQCAAYYAFYNWTPSATKKHWHCARTFDASQLGVSMLSASIIDSNHLGRRGGRTFDSIHTTQQTRPWRCLLADQFQTSKHSVTRASATSQRYDAALRSIDDRFASAPVDGTWPTWMILVDDLG